MKVYIAGPYTKGDVAQNVRDAIFIGNQLLDEGHTPFIPHLTHFWHMIYYHAWKTWLEYDLQWLMSCDALIRLPGTSTGADQEVEAASRIGIPIFSSVNDFLKAYSDARS